MKFCHNCGFQCEDNDKFCKKCGTNLILTDNAEEQADNIVPNNAHADSYREQPHKAYENPPKQNFVNNTNTAVSVNAHARKNPAVKIILICIAMLLLLGGGAGVYIYKTHPEMLDLNTDREYVDIFGDTLESMLADKGGSISALLAEFKLPQDTPLDISSNEALYTMPLSKIGEAYRNGTAGLKIRLQIPRRRSKSRQIY